METKKAKEILKHLIATRQGFCFFDGVVVNKEYCTAILVRDYILRKAKEMVKNEK
jgi:hypothetical protein